MSWFSSEKKKKNDDGEQFSFFLGGGVIEKIMSCVSLEKKRRMTSASKNTISSEKGMHFTVSQD